MKMYVKCNDVNRNVYNRFRGHACLYFSNTLFLSSLLSLCFRLPGQEKQAVLPLTESVVCLPVYTCCAELPAPVQQAQTGRQMAAHLTGYTV